MTKTKNYLRRDYSMLTDACKFTTFAYICVVFAMVNVSMFLSGELTKDLFLRCTFISLMMTSLALVALGVVNLIACFIAKVFKIGVKCSAKSFTSGILVCSVYGRQTLVPLIASGTVFAIFAMLNGATGDEGIKALVYLTLVCVGVSLIGIGIVSMICTLLKAAFSFLKTHKITLAVEKR